MADGWLRTAASTLLLAACSAGAPERVTLGTVHLPALGLVFIAEERGFFAARGLAVEQRRFATSRDAIAALAAGEVDAATAFETPVVFRAAQDDLEVVTTLHTSSRTTRVMARADRGIAREGDLAGKRIGVTRGTHAEYFLCTLLAYAGVESSAREVDLEPAAAVDALAAGDVDAIALWSPHVERARRLLGPGGSVELGSDIHTEISMLVVRDATHQARRGVLVKLVSALADAERLVHERPEEAVRALRASFPELSDAELRDIWSRVVPALGLTHELAAVLERQAVWFRSAGRIAGPPIDLGAVIDPDVLTAVDPEAVTFVSPPRGKAPR